MLIISILFFILLKKRIPLLHSFSKSGVKGVSLGMCLGYGWYILFGRKLNQKVYVVIIASVPVIGKPGGNQFLHGV